MHMLIFDYIYRRPFSFSDPTQNIQSHQRVYQCYCHLNTLMVNLLDFLLGKNRNGGKRRAVTGWTMPKPVSWLCSHYALSHASEVADHSIAVCINTLTPLQHGMWRAG